MFVLNSVVGICRH